MNKIKKYLFIIYIANLISASEKLEIINADYLESFKEKNQTIQKLHGNVILQSKNLKLFTEDANYYPDINEFHLINGVVMIKENDTLRCQKIIHFNDTNSFLKAIGDIYFLQENHITMCDSLYYW